MSLDQGLELARKCVDQLKLRFLMSQPKFLVKVVDKNGTKIVDLSSGGASEEA